MILLISIILTVSVLLNLTGCSVINAIDRSTGAKQIEKKLEEKYGERFTVTGIRRDGDPVMPTTSVSGICYANNRPDLTFDVSLSKPKDGGFENGKLSDNYVERMILSQLDNIVNSKFQENSIDIYATASVPLDLLHADEYPENPNIPLDEFIE